LLQTNAHSYFMFSVSLLLSPSFLTFLRNNIMTIQSFKLFLREHWRVIAGLLFVAVVGLAILGLAAFYPPAIGVVFGVAGISMAAHSVAAQIFITSGIAAAAATIFTLAVNALVGIVNSITRVVQPDAIEYTSLGKDATTASKEQHALNTVNPRHFSSPIRTATETDVVPQDNNLQSESPSNGC
jgi:hypothetical protein